MTVAAFMDLALYDPELGYYARAARRTGRAGDFFTSVDVGPLFGELLEVQIAEMFRVLQTSDSRLQTFDLIEAGAGDGRLAADILRAARARNPSLYESLRLHLVEASAAARAAQPATLAEVGERLVSSASALPESFEGVLIANELLDALPTHQVVMREEGLHEVYVQANVARPFQGRGEGGPERPALRTSEAPPSTPALQQYLDALDIQLEPGWRAEINLLAVEWMRDAARRLRRGFIIIIDYGHEARDLYSASHAGGTLTTFAVHRSAGPERGPAAPAWLQHPGGQDLTAHVDFTSIRAAAEAEGMTTVAFLDQTYFLLGLLSSSPDLQSAISNRQFKVLVMPGGLGSTHKVLILAKGVGTPALQGCSFKVRVT